MKRSHVLQTVIVLSMTLLAIVALRWTHSPLHAVATDRAGSTIVCTARCDQVVEALFFFDTSTGLLEGYAPARRAGLPVQSRWVANVSDDMMALARQMNVEVPKSPKFTMVSGAIDAYKTQGNIRPSLDLVFVTEVTSGLSIAYIIPWNQALHSNSTAFSAPLQIWATTRFATGAPVEAATGQ
ncbi:MAG: hypothetical protein Q4C47_02555 [Planctomycetia bacterium]|nr:hypothetical protein [Planctomycetia bacterium]